MKTGQEYMYCYLDGLRKLDNHDQNILYLFGVWEHTFHGKVGEFCNGISVATMYSFKYFYSLRLLKSWSPLETDDNVVCWQMYVYQIIWNRTYSKTLMRYWQLNINAQLLSYIKVKQFARSWNVRLFTKLCPSLFFVSATTQRAVFIRPLYPYSTWVRGIIFDSQKFTRPIDWSGKDWAACSTVHGFSIPWT